MLGRFYYNGSFLLLKRFRTVLFDIITAIKGYIQAAAANVNLFS